MTPRARTATVLACFLSPTTIIVGEFLQAMVSYLIGYLLISQVGLRPKSVSSQMFAPTATFRAYGPGAPRCRQRRLIRSQPRRHDSRVILDQHPDEPLERAENRPMQHHRNPCGCCLRLHTRRPAAPASRNRPASCRTATRGQCVFQRVLDLGAIESAFAGRDLEVNTFTPQRLDSALLGLVPDFIRTDTLIRPVDTFYQNLFEPEVGIDLLQQRRVCDALVRI